MDAGQHFLTTPVAEAKSPMPRVPKDAKKHTSSLSALLHRSKGSKMPTAGEGALAHDQRRPSVDSLDTIDGIKAEQERTSAESGKGANSKPTLKGTRQSPMTSMDRLAAGLGAWVPEKR